MPKFRRDVAIMFCNTILGLSTKAQGGPWSIESMEEIGPNEMMMTLKTDIPYRDPSSDRVGRVRVIVQALPPEESAE